MRVAMQTSAVCFTFPISMNIMHEQPRRTWPQNVPYSHLTGVDTEGGIVGPLRFSLREEGPPCAISIASLSRVAVARGLCRCFSHSMPQPSEALAFRRRVFDLSTHRATFIRCHMHALPQFEEDADAPAILCRTPVAASSSWLRVSRCYMNRMFTSTAYELRVGAR